MKVGIFGGSFNPIHNGHLIISEFVREELGLDKIFFIPVGIPAHKKTSELASAEHRKRMVELAIESNEDFQSIEYEINKKEMNYTIDTLKYLKETYPNYEFFEIIGEDSAQNIHSWKNFQELISMCKFVVLKREGSEFENTNNEMLVVNSPVIQISATDIRNRIKKGKSSKYLVPDNVLEYMIKENVYGGN